MVLVGCGCDERDDDSEPDDDADDDQGEGPGQQPAVWDEDNAWRDFQLAEHYVSEATYSTALLYYKSAIAKLTDDDPFNNGPCPAGTLDRARYGASACLMTVPMKIIEGFIESWAAGDDNAVADFLEDWYRGNHDIDPDEPLPRSIITDYLAELIIPKIDEALTWIDPVLEDHEFYYDMPQIKITFMNTAIVIPDRDIDGRGRHGLAEAALISAVYHFASALTRSLYAYNLDIDAPRIDEILQILMSGDLAEILALGRQYPDLLKLHTIETSGIDGQAAMHHAKADWIAFVSRLFDDNDDDGVYGIDPENGYDPGELPNDLADALHLDPQPNESSVLWLLEGNLLVNISLNSAPFDSSLLSTIWGLLDTQLVYPFLDGFTHAFFGWLPIEKRADNGLDDDLASGVSTGITRTALVDANASFEPGSMVGAILNPNTLQNVLGHENRTFVVVSNDSTSINVEGDLTEVAKAGDPYSVGDGEIDDGPISLGLILSLLFSGRFPIGWDVEVLINAPFDVSPDFRDVIPLTDGDLGDPDLYYIVADRTEWYEDLNSNGRYDPGVDVLHDAAHAYGEFSYQPDGLYQPVYLYFVEPTFGGLLTFKTGAQHYEPNDMLNWLIFGLAGVAI